MKQSIREDQCAAEGSRNMAFSVLFFFLVLLGSTAWNPVLLRVEKLKMEMESYTLHKGKKAGVKGEVYFRRSGSLLVTRSTFPSEKITRTNSLGEYFEYDVKNNSVIHLMGKEVSSRFSLFHAFFNGSTSDMGLADNGFVLKKTRIEGKLVVTDWEPSRKESKISRAELVHEDNLPVFLAFYDLKNKPVQKAFYNDYKLVGAIRFPHSLTEFEYVAPGDSVITRKKYRNPVLNEAVEDNWFQFRVPASAKKIQPGK